MLRLRLGCSSCIRASKLRRTRTMASHSNTQPIQETKAQTPAKIIHVYNETPNVKLLQLKVEDESFTFKPGQWVDFFPPGVDKIGGYSICSTPLLLQQTRTFHLAVKESRHPVASWIHTKARRGDVVGVRVGGTFVLEEADTAGPVLMVTGGIGVTPLYSMFRHMVEAAPTNHRIVATMLYMARGPQQHALVAGLQEVEAAAQAAGHHVQVKLFNTAQPVPVPEAPAGRPQTPTSARARLLCGLSALNCLKHPGKPKAPGKLAPQDAVEPDMSAVGSGTAHGIVEAWIGAEDELGGEKEKEGAAGLRRRAVAGRVTRAHLKSIIMDLEASALRLSRLHAAATAAPSQHPARDSRNGGRGGEGDEISDEVEEIGRGSGAESKERATPILQGPMSAFLCGPPQMTDDLEAELRSLGVSRIRLERWW